MRNSEAEDHHDDLERFSLERERLNQIVMNSAGLGMKRFISLDHQMYQPGALDQKTKEMMGLLASLVLRCDDCVTYHLMQCKKVGVTTEVLEETMSIGLLVGGSIVIPHLRRAFDLWEKLQNR